MQLALTENATVLCWYQRTTQNGGVVRRKKPYQIHDRPQRQPCDVPGATPEDLALNAQGYLSVSQKALIADDMEAPRLFTMIFWGLAVVLLGIATVYGTNSYLPSAVFAACGLPFARRWTVARRAIRNNQVVCLEGPLYTETYTLMDSKRGGQWQELNVHHIRIGKEVFTLPDRCSLSWNLAQSTGSTTRLRGAIWLPPS